MQREAAAVAQPVEAPPQAAPVPAARAAVVVQGGQQGATPGRRRWRRCRRRGWSRGGRGGPYVQAEEDAAPDEPQMLAIADRAASEETAALNALLAGAAALAKMPAPRMVARRPRRATWGAAGTGAACG
jgi:hypothetical protein